MRRPSARRCADCRGCCGAIRPTPSAVLWQALVNDRRFAGRGFKRQVPIGAHIADFVSFPLRCVIDLVPRNESEAAAALRAGKRAWLVDHDYRIIGIAAGEVEADVARALDTIAAQLRAGERG